MRYAALIAVPLTGLAVSAGAWAPGDILHYEPRPYNVNYPPAVQRTRCHPPTPTQLADLSGFKATAAEMVAYERATGEHLEAPRVPVVILVTPTPVPVELPTPHDECRRIGGSVTGAVYHHEWIWQQTQPPNMLELVTLMPYPCTPE